MKAFALVCSCVALAVSGVLPWPSEAWAEPEGPSPSAAPPEPKVPPPAPLAEELQGQAKMDYDAGRLLFDAGDYGRALLLFQSAYAAAPDPRLLWDAAACERNLRHYVKAIAIVRRFLATHSPLVTAEAATQAQAFLDAAEPLTAPLEVESNPPNAEVYLDDEDLGPARLGSESRVDVGIHKIVVKQRGFEPYSATLSVADSARVQVTVVLHAIAAPPPVSSSGAERDRGPSRSTPVPTWVWLAGGGVVLAGIATASYFLFKPGPRPEPIPGSIGSALRF
jgi:hypothetical protein